MAESSGSVNVSVNVLNGTLARDVHVLLMTSLNDSSATGRYSASENQFATILFFFLCIEFI